jgi:hypothetical protein
MIRIGIFAVVGTLLALTVAVIDVEQLRGWEPGLVVAGLIIGLMLGLAMGAQIARSDAEQRASEAYWQIGELADREPLELASAIATVFAIRLGDESNAPAADAARRLSIALDELVTEHRAKAYAERHELVGDERIEP